MRRGDARSVGVRVGALGAAAAALLLAQPLPFCCRTLSRVCGFLQVTCTVLYVIYKLTLQHKDEWTRLEVTEVEQLPPRAFRHGPGPA